MGKFIIWVLINVFVFLAAVFSLEIVVRIVFPRINLQGMDRHLFVANKLGNSYGLRSSAEGYIFGERIKTDAIGLRIDPSLNFDRKNRKGILFVGDSIACGTGVPASRSFPFLIQKYFDGYHVYNAAIHGYEIDNYLNAINYLIPKINCETIVVCICLNDFTPISQKIILAEVNKNAENENVRSLFSRINNSFFNFNEQLRHRSKAYNLIKGVFSNASQHYSMADKRLYAYPETEQYIAQEFRAIQKLALKNQKKVVFFVFPYEYQLHSNLQYNEINHPQEVIKRAAKREAVLLVDLYPFLKEFVSRHGQDSRALYLFGDPMHLSVLGHEIAAKAISKELKERKLTN